MSRYTEIPITRDNGKRYYVSSFYPTIPLSSNDIYAITDFGDRLDILANQFYGDPSLYWVLAAANPDLVSPDSISVKGGIQLRIPVDIDDIIATYEASNSVGTSLTATNVSSVTAATSITSGTGGGGGGGY